MRRRIIHLLQFLFAVTFFFSGTAKCIDPAGTSIKLAEYLHYFGIYWFDDFTMGLAWLLSLVEFLCGFQLLMGRGRIMALFLASAMMLLFTPLTGWLALTGAIQDCGCFGDAVHLTNAQTFVKNLVLDLVLVVLWWRRRSLYQLAGPTAYTLYKYAVFAFLIFLCYRGTFHEPVVDFRPFLPGTDLRAAVCGSPSSSASAADVEYICVYARGGQECEFTLDALPDEADGWEFVRTEERSLTPASTSAPSQPDIDLFMLDSSDALVTADVLSHPGPTYLLVSPSLDKASQHDIDKIERLYEFAQEEGHPFYGLTARSDDQLQRWQQNTGAEYPFLFTDATIAHTLCRSNPCLVLLCDGVLISKTPLVDLDVDALTSAKLNEQTGSQPAENAPLRSFSLILILLFAPFALFLLIEITQLFYNNKLKDSKDA